MMSGVDLKPTGNTHVDAVLQSVEWASSYVHDSSQWECCPTSDEPSYAYRIEDRAQAVADEITRLQAELEAAKRETAEARDKALEEAAARIDTFSGKGRFVSVRTNEVCDYLAGSIRALKHKGDG